MCKKEVPQETYEKMTQEINSFLSGGHEEIKKELQRKMHEAAEELYFERAKELRDQIINIDALMEKQKITMADAKDRDVFGFAVDKGWMCVQILYMRQGKMIERHASVFPFYGEAYGDFLSYVTQYYSDNPAVPQEILLPELKGLAGDEESVDSAETVIDATGVTASVAGGESLDPASGAAALQQWLGVKVLVPQRGLRSRW